MIGKMDSGDPEADEGRLPGDVRVCFYPTTVEAGPTS